MRRAVAILKYIPAVVCGLLVVACVASIAYPHQLSLSDLGWTGNFNASLSLAHDRINWQYCHWAANGTYFTSSRGAMPFLAPIALLLPLAVGCLTYFRFPLWSYFAWTALVAAELAYYLSGT